MSDITHDEHARPPGSHSATLVAITLVTLSVIGYEVGVRQPHEPVRPEIPVRAESGAPPAYNYSTIGDARRGPNADWKSVFTALKAKATPPEPPADRTVAWQQAADKRAERRAFDGAPPVIPHAVEQRSAAACLSCHGQGQWIDNAFAPIMSHESRRDCLACHVEQSSRLQSAPQPLPVGGSSWMGRTSSRGDRAQPLGPPTIPHTPQQIAWARENCLSCHGPNGRPGLAFTADSTAHRDSTTNARCLSCHVQDPGWCGESPRR